MGYERTDVDSVESARSALKGATLLVPERKTFYGAKEIFVRDPDGNVLGFAEHE
jgi:catechol 2,3-dioxygenase-like lactoylglutathione lyase family enzyme